MARSALVAVVVFSGCFVPVVVDPPDGSVPLPDSGWLVPCDSTASIDLTPGAPFSIFAGCANATVTVIGPDGGVVGTEGTTITPTGPGVYVVDTEHDGQTQQTFVHVDGPIDSSVGFTRTYVDRVDGQTAFNLAFTEGGRLIDSVGPHLFVYEPDGGFGQEIPLDFGYFSDMAVEGGELWVTYRGVVQHYSETNAGLQLDGTTPPSFPSSQVFFTDVGPGRVVASSESGVYELVWTGSDVEVRTSFSAIPNGESFIESDALWSSMFCSVQPGCQTQVCAPVHTCNGPTRRVLGHDHDELLWVANNALGYPTGINPMPGDVMLQLMRRPVSAPTIASPARTIPMLPLAMQYSFGVQPARFWAGNQFIVPMPQNGSFYFARLDDVRLVNTRYVVVQGEDPFTLRFIPR